MSSRSTSFFLCWQQKLNAILQEVGGIPAQSCCHSDSFYFVLTKLKPEIGGVSLLYYHPYLRDSKALLKLPHLWNTLWSLWARSFRICFANLKDRSVDRRDPSCYKEGYYCRWYSQPAWNPVSLPSSTDNNVFSQRSLSPSPPACNHMKVLTFLFSIKREFFLAKSYLQKEDGCWISFDSCPSPSSLMESSWTVFKRFSAREEGEVELTQALTHRDCTAFCQKTSPPDTYLSDLSARQNTFPICEISLLPPFRDALQLKTFFSSNPVCSWTDQSRYHRASYTHVSVRLLLWNVAGSQQSF